MSYLLVEELRTGNRLDQKFRSTSIQTIEAVRPHLYIHNVPVGSLTLTIHDNNQNLICTGETIPILSMSSSGFFHGYIKFNIDCVISNDQQFYVRITGPGYTFAESAFVGMCKVMGVGDYKKYESEYTPDTNHHSPFDIEIWKRRNKQRNEL